MSAVPHPHDAEAPRVEPPPKPDKAAMRAALDAMFSLDDVIELHALHKGRKRTDAGISMANTWKAWSMRRQD